MNTSSMRLTFMVFIAWKRLLITHSKYVCIAAADFYVSYGVAIGHFGFATSRSRLLQDAKISRGFGSIHILHYDKVMVFEQVPPSMAGR